LVQLHFYKVFEWQGELQMREGQQFAWQSLPVQVSPVLPGTLPVLEWLAQAQSSISNSALSVAA
jgi:8-oxo-dGTP diphosphatase